MTPEQEIRVAALNAAVAWAGKNVLTEPIMDTAERFARWITRPQQEIRTAETDGFYCAGGLTGCEHRRDQHGKYGCEVGTASMNTPLCPCEREDGK